MISWLSLIVIDCHVLVMFLTFLNSNLKYHKSLPQSSHDLQSFSLSWTILDQSSFHKGSCSVADVEIVEVVRVAESNGLKLPREFALLVKQAVKYSEVSSCQQLSAAVSSCQQLSAAVSSCQQLSAAVSSCQQLSAAVSCQFRHVQNVSDLNSGSSKNETLKRWWFQIFGRPYTLIATPNFWLQQITQWYQDEARTNSPSTFVLEWPWPEHSETTMSHFYVISMSFLCHLWLTL